MLRARLTGVASLDEDCDEEEEAEEAAALDAAAELDDADGADELETLLAALSELELELPPPQAASKLAPITLANKARARFIRFIIPPEISLVLEDRILQGADDMCATVM